MKSCPNCGELIGDNVNECFKCHYNYSYKQVITAQEIRNRREEKEREKENKIQNLQTFEKEKEIQIKRNPLYEYKTELVNDLHTGEVDNSRIQLLLKEYASKGWRLHSAFVNEIGKSSVAASISFLGMNVNATIGQTILIFERCIRA